MSDTPRTDSQSSFDEFDVESCDASFARELERELSAANTQIGLLIAGSKQQERQIEFLKGRVKQLEESLKRGDAQIERLLALSIRNESSIQRLVEAGDKAIENIYYRDRVNFWTKSKEGL